MTRKETGKRDIHHIGGWINSGAYIAHNPETGDPAMIRMEFSRWTMALLKAHRQFRIGRDLFTLTRALERRLHMMLDTKSIYPGRNYRSGTLHSRCAPEMNERKFRYRLRNISEAFGAIYVVAEESDGIFRFMRRELTHTDEAVAGSRANKESSASSGASGDRARRSKRTKDHRAAVTSFYD